jgi:hypothetical protein
MALTNTLKNQVDLPVWEWLRFAPAVASASTCSCSSDNSLYHPNHGRYIYYMLDATNGFWRYDTVTDMYQRLANPVATIGVGSSMRFAGAIGYYGRVISASSNTITTSTHTGECLKGFDIKIIGGTGMGQQRTITGVGEPVAADSGIATAVTSTTSLLRITDSTKNWTVNQWVGYQVRITFNTGVSQIRKILYNDATSITFGDINQLAQNTIDAMAPMATSIVATAGSQAVYSIESGTITVDTNWAVQPDATSRFVVQSGGVFHFTNFAISYYDIVTDTWYYRSTISNILSGTTPTDLTLERQTENSTVWDKGTATGGTTTSLVDSTKQWTTDEFVGYYVRIFSGTGEGQLRPITGNTSNTLSWSSAGTAPTTSSKYMIEGFESGTSSSGTATTLTDSSKAWTTNRWANYYLVITGGTGIGQGRSIVSNTDTAITVTPPFDTNPDSTSTYRIQGDNDKLFFLAAAQTPLFCYNIENDMMSLNKRYDGGSCRIGAARYSDHPALAIATTTRSGTTATVTTAQNHNFKTGMTIVHTGATGVDASLYNISASITVTGATTYTYTMSGTPSANAVFTANSTTVLVDSTKNWTTNQWAGYVVYMNTNQAISATGQIFRIASNTSNTLTIVATGTAPTNGVTRYVICKDGTFGDLDRGIATGSQSTSTLQDTSKSWVTNIYAGRRVKLVGGTGVSQEAIIASNTSNTLTFTAVVTTAPVTANTSYSIMAQGIRGAGIELNWIYNNDNANTKGRYMIAARGGAVAGFDRYDIASDSWNMLATVPFIETLGIGSMYAYDGGNRLYFTKEATLRMYYLDIDTLTIHGAGNVPYIAGTGTIVIGNRMEIFETEDHLKFLWLTRHNSFEGFRILLFF